MTTPAGSQHVGIVMTARDNASRNIGKVRQSLRGLGKSLKSAALSVVSFSAIISGLGVSIVALVALGTRWVKNVIATNRAVSRLGVTLRSSGFSADFTNKRLREMRENLDRLTLQTLPGLSREMQEAFLQLTPKSQIEIEQLAKRLAEVAGVDYKTAFAALNAGLTGNMEPLQKLGIGANTLADASKEIDTNFQWLLDNEGGLSSFWRGFKEDAGEVLKAISGLGRAMLLAILQNETLNRLGGVMASMLAGPFISFFSIEKWTEIMDKVAKALNIVTGEDENGSFKEAGKNLAKAIALGILEHFIGEDNVERIRLAFKGGINLAAIGELFVTFLKATGKWIGGKILAGITWFFLGPFGLLLDTAWGTALKDWVKRMLRPMWDGGKEMAASLGKGLMDGLFSAVSTAAAWMVRQVNKIIDAFNSAMGRFGATMNRLSGVDITRPNNLSSDPRAVGRPRGSGPGTARLEQPVTVVLNGREVARALMEVVDGELRIRQPGLAIN